MHRSLATAAVSASAAGFVSCNTKFVGCATLDRQESKKSGSKKMERQASKKLADASTELSDFELFHAYQVHFSEEATNALTLNDLTEILLHVGILDKTISELLFNSLLAMDSKRMTKKKKKTSVETTTETEAEEKKASFASFCNLCSIFAKGEDLAKFEVMFDFMDPDKSGMADKNEISIAVRHLLWCQTNWYGEEILYDGAHDLDLYFEVPTEAIAQLKANKFAHDLVMGCHGGGRQLAVTQKQFLQWMATGGKKVETLKGLFSLFGAFPAPEFSSYEE